MIIGKTKLKPFLISISIVATSAFLLVSTGYAASLVSLEGSDSVGGYYDSYYGYHSSSSGTTTNNTTKWQALGDSADTGSYGVTWTTTPENDESWGHEDLYVGQTVKFKFMMSSANQGTHYGNVLKSWIAWGGDDTFDSNDVVASGFDKVDSQTAGSSVEYYSETITITEDMIGTAYLRARVTCTESIFSTNLDKPYWCWDSQWSYNEQTYVNAFDAYDAYWQGEIEEWAITVSEASTGHTSPVPEPATFALFGIGLLGLAGISRKKFNS